MKNLNLFLDYEKETKFLSFSLCGGMGRQRPMECMPDGNREAPSQNSEDPLSLAMKSKSQMESYLPNGVPQRLFKGKELPQHTEYIASSDGITMGVDKTGLGLAKAKLEAARRQKEVNNETKRIEKLAKNTLATEEDPLSQELGKVDTEEKIAMQDATDDHKTALKSEVEPDLSGLLDKYKIPEVSAA